MRGIHISRLRSIPALAVPVLETGMEEAMVLAESMDARGHGRGRRTRYRPERWSVAAVVVVAATVVAVVAFLGASRGSWGDVIVSTYPLAWPQAATQLLLAVVLLAAPGLVPGGPRE